MKIEAFSKIKEERQDGAIFGGYLFSFNDRGICTVYQMESLEKEEDGETEIFSEFILDKNDIIMPHSNSVMFGNEFYTEDDEFPLLYTNIYNNYAQYDDKLKGTCLVYRLQRFDRKFETKLVQMIEIGFVENERLWKSAGKQEDRRPYGNFTIDRDKGIYYAFVMRDNLQTTRYFSFNLPKVQQGEVCEKYNVKKVVLNEFDILEYFDCDYHHCIQGACCHEGKIYSLEGFTDDPDNPPAIRIINPNLKKEVFFKKFKDLGITVEPEMIDFVDNICVYSDYNGKMYKVFFEF